MRKWIDLDPMQADFELSQAQILLRMGLDAQQRDRRIATPLPSNATASSCDRNEISRSGPLLAPCRLPIPHLLRGLLQSLQLWGLSLLCLVAIATTAPTANAIPLSPAFSIGTPQTLILQTPNTVNDLQELQRLIDQYRSGVSKERDRLKNLEQGAKNKLNNLQENLETTDAQIDNIEIQLEKATQQLQQSREQLALAERTYQQKRAGTIARLRFLQRQKGLQGLSILLQSQDLNEFLDRRRQLKRVFKADRQILTRLKTEADRIEQQKLEIEQHKNNIALFAEQLLAQKADLETQAESQKFLIKRLNSDRKALEAAEDRLARDSQNLAILIRQRVSTRSGGGIIYGTGRMVYPTYGSITSRFGWRSHPILGSQRFHAGLDFGASYGTAIRAADSGAVIFAGWYGGYGNAVVIDHGNGISTLYGHASSLYVTEGQTVKQGQPIAAVGSTGLSTGPHLHFEVRRNGQPVDPLAYL